MDTFKGYETFARVTSDCKPWPRGGKLGICQDCGCVQALIDETWEEEANQIYRNYAIWHQSGGAEQSVFDTNSGEPVARSWRIIDRLKREISLPSQGRLLDIGCGNGSLLKSASQLLPEWALAGTEFDDRYRAQIEGIPRVERLYAGSLEDVPGAFDLITLCHVFEHWTAPKRLLKLILSKLKTNGCLLIQVPDFTQNPFELLVADHCTHFCPSSLAGVVTHAGYTPRILSTNWVQREITLVAQLSIEPPAPVDFPSQDALVAVEESLAALNAMRARACENINRRQFGIFGTSIAGTWLYGELNAAVRFFVDEDPQRTGKLHLGLPILLPRNVPENSLVFVALPDSVASTVSTRLRKVVSRTVEVMTSDQP